MESSNAMNVKCFFCEKEAMSDTATLEPCICIDCAAILERGKIAHRIWNARQELNDALKEAARIKQQGEKLYIAQVFVFPNGNVAATDQFGSQMPDYQGTWDEVRFKLIPAVEAQEIKPLLHDQFGVGALIR
jgi:uncharacterized protein YuzE